MELNLATYSEDTDYTNGDDPTGGSDTYLVLGVGDTADSLAGDDGFFAIAPPLDEDGLPFFGAAIDIAGELSTSSGDDQLFGYGFIGIRNSVSGVIDTGSDADQIIGATDNGLAGIFNSGDILTGSGGDSIWGDAYNNGALAGLYNSGFISMASGDDFLSSAGPIGILNDGSIDMGSGRDIVDTSRSDQGFDGSGQIDLGNGNDTIIGFGTQTVYGGAGWDQAVIADYSLSQLRVTHRPGFSRGIVLEYIPLGQKMTYVDVESFQIGRETYSYSTLAFKHAVGLHSISILEGKG